MARHDENDRKRWADMQRMGRTRFILARGVLAWGLTTAVLYTLLMTLFDDAAPLPTLLLSLVLFPLGGIGWGALMWRVFHRRYGASSVGAARVGR